MEIKIFKFDSLSVHASIVDSTLRVDWFGSSNSLDPDRYLEPIFEWLQKSRSGQPIDMHFETLEFFNSSTMVFIVKEVNAFRRQRIPMHLSFSKASRWQKIFGDALSMFNSADGQFHVEVV